LVFDFDRALATDTIMTVWDMERSNWEERFAAPPD
jgi:hypothetical protein